MLIKKNFKCCQWFSSQPFILCEAALPRSHHLQNDVGEKCWELPLPAQVWEPSCYSECEEKPADFWLPPWFKPWEADTCVAGAAFAGCCGLQSTETVQFDRLMGQYPFHGCLSISPALWTLSLVLPHPSSRAGREPKPWCHSPAFTLRESSKDWK